MQIALPEIGLQYGQRNMLYTLFVVLTQKGGGIQPFQHLRWAEQELLKLDQGLTRHQAGTGIWVPPPCHPLCRDLILPFQLVTTPDRQQEAKVIALAAEMAQVFEQDEIFILAQPVWRLNHAQLAGPCPTPLSKYTPKGE